MIIDSLSLLDFRVFSGLHTFDLIPKLKRGKQAPIVLFGGLNGGGKTTILSALKLALYGKGAMSTAATSADYHRYLRECIHHAPQNIVQPTRSALELTFRYALHGVISTYHLKRDWLVERTGRVREGLLISRDGQDLSELSYDQAQSFLNELIPLGVSELFFFDGEKIADLAEETSGEALKDSINKLLGLDIIDRLDSDLAVLIRTRAAKGASEERKKRIAGCEKEYAEAQEAIDLAKDQLVQLKLEISETEQNVGQLHSQLNARGGAWSSSRQDEANRLDALVSQKRQLEDSLRDLASGLLPLAIPEALVQRSIEKLHAEQSARSERLMMDFVRKQEDSFVAKSRSLLGVSAVEARQLYLATFGEVLTGLSSSASLVHDVPESRIASMEHRLMRVLKAEQEKAADIAGELNETDAVIDALGENIARAPDENVLAPLLKEQAELHERLGALKAQRSIVADATRAQLNRLAGIARRLDEYHAEAANLVEKERTFSMANKTRDVLREFSLRARAMKLAELEAQFYSSFNRLARKEDRHLSIRIDPSTFEVSLFDQFDEEIRKQQLSAGEKQIFAISILEALARTSGRSLPVVIDTPLGRLDSIHRKKLVDHYFPKTSHQVVILSTDTEIDATFYEALSPHISHSYHLMYDPETRSTRVEPGYFWRQAEYI
ncbi:DNA sulfur modification protein DndD [Stutzerimonas nitrititolerans]|uniref:DNA sulfur modification protein DndD n=1 Tax=Stutzerimonas nitrititolerans TaxID=2482751 RepID=A0AA41WIS4_9GAMM|nr:DNA sulfur modification protein DndD [Stutzerimonas nitrititolerans]